MQPCCNDEAQINLKHRLPAMITSEPFPRRDLVEKNLITAVSPHWAMPIPRWKKESQGKRKSRQQWREPTISRGSNLISQFQLKSVSKTRQTKQALHTCNTQKTCPKRPAPSGTEHPTTDAHYYRAAQRHHQQKQQHNMTTRARAT